MLNDQMQLQHYGLRNAEGIQVQLRRRLRGGMKAADSDDLLWAVLEADLMRINGGEDSLISVHVFVNDNPEEIVDVHCTADVLQAVQSKLGIAGAASAPVCRNTAYQQRWQDNRGSSSVRRRSRAAHLRTTMFSMVPGSQLLRYPSVPGCIHLDSKRIVEARPHVCASSRSLTQSLIMKSKNMACGQSRWARSSPMDQMAR